METAMDVGNILGYSFPQRTDFHLFSSFPSHFRPLTFLSFQEAKIKIFSGTENIFFFRVVTVCTNSSQSVQGHSQDEGWVNTFW